MKIIANVGFALALLIAPVGAFAAGAIAIVDEEGLDPEDVGYGIGYGKSKEAAQAAAMNECKKAGNTGCKVAVWFETCGAYAGNKTHYGIGYGRSEAIAKKMALDECGAKSCKIIVSDCDK
ncbi:DUF4189 domain-containing protein [Lacibacterium aquatile]|uniref:DUF4189 domain-containing protein n=1 Tax=Lacibacterium aquatile TaxID=1168082 RepID=A0ABW5DWR0_9PROT